MNRRTALVALTTVAALAAVVGAGSGTTGSRAQADPAIESIVLSVGLTLVAAVVLVLVVGLVMALLRHERGTTFANESTGPRLVAVLVLVAIVAFVVFVLHPTAHHHELHTALPVAVNKGLVVTKGKSVPFNGTASAATAGLVLAIIGSVVGARLLHGYLARRNSAPIVFHERAVAGLTPEAVDTAGRAMTEPGTLPDPAAIEDPREAVLTAYRRFLLLMARLGAARRQSETPLEYSLRLVDGQKVIGSEAGEDAATRRLTSLFTTARYSTEPMTAGDRLQAIGDIEVISGALE